MAGKRRSTRAKNIKTGATRAQGIWEFLSVGTLTGAVLLILILGAVLKVDAGSDAIRSAETLIEPTSPGDWLAEDEDTPLPGSPSTPALTPDKGPAPSSEKAAADDIALRAIDDAERLASSGRDWTLQFMVTGRPESAQGILQRLGGDSRLYLLPMVLDGEPCFRICWGTYQTREAALSAPGIPAQLLGLNPEPLPRQISDLVR